MTTYLCPKGHASSTDDFCDTCGARIGGTVPVSAPASAPPAAAPPSPARGTPCPNCGTPRTAMWRFCEDCGFDHTTGKVPALDTPPAAARPAGPWTATVTADRTYFDANAIEGVEFPAHCPERRYVLPTPQARIGRRSTSKGTDPEIDLSAAPLDPGVSHSHALLTVNVDGGWLVSDLGSTNGTYVNDEATPLSAGQSRTLGDGDRVHVGAWTTITLHAPAN
ncbi:double zinc ribbon protein [Krasilnikovia cinnamomea]|uniref:Double zinc ribbon protein n=1 Tax=Krasilnikovia cinnamomea TaxID=349313 RepID=A0A4Q7ZCX7_9ACTN|nr:FHA domain-containing protein [Krasilnikovia cinnamomea]RZU48510.1 double zinc ribbon protein [Krasilnikovia cinnamomea]